ncbi:FG-nucleoporin NUP60 SKDI_01G0730 [Saccharomyces kudriavzevii IFO 1802]|uniref:NUP60-like protein n=1 Tax=Saccharomyces kudriavzevii (strain ATCC MYA-4449 / AS 2.2408 / CBS 8840 / NBRC 1802 / NCYC 2889) TaxID=226230 RepID=A0AA35NPP9_SACK1|nr:uncharacterized protein SKDI_01G0730 [Saccharomyces kudriavzevii IFO 1802]CAI4054616.1 hypothetical protein SKDI_01G0730 [Saccharomyces kudriavzevii IFO 1802]
MHRKSLRRASANTSLAPYRKQVISNARNKPGLFSKIKSFFSQNDSTKTGTGTRIANTKSGNKVPDRRISSMPGGYFYSNTSTDYHFNRSGAVSSLKEDSDDVENNEEQCDETREANISNAQLANFFSKKGNEPLSEIEIEGVMSLLQKSNKSMNTSKRGQKSSESSNADHSLILKESGSTPISVSNAPTFNPKYDTTTVSNASMNTTLGTIGSRKYSFNYSSLPSPYKTTVYRYSAAKKISDTYTANTSVQSAVSAKSTRAGVTKPTSTKKMSNTAAALVSLLDEKDIKRSNPVSELANPYSSYVSQIRKHKKEFPSIVSRQEDSQEPKTKALSEKLPEGIEESVKQSNNVKISPPAPSKDSFAKYKPARSSSLRSNVVVAETSPEKKESVVKPPSSTFNFSFIGAKNVEPAKDEYNNGNAPPTPSKEFNFTKLHTKPKTELTKGDFIPVEGDFSVTPQKNVSNSFVFNSVQKKPQSILPYQNDNKIKSIDASVKSDIPKSDLEEFDFNIPVSSKLLGNGSVDENKVEAFKSLYTF